MKRLALFGSWKRLGIQLGLLGGVGLAFVGGTEKPATAGGQCPSEDDCSFKKPNFMIIMDYSSSMHADFGGNQTRWEAAVEAVQNLVTAQNGYFDDNMHMALMRFGHDPSPNSSGTTIPGDTSGIVDGQSLDVHWYDPNNGPDYPYYECNGQAIVDFLDNVPPPLCNGNPCSGIGTWTQGALQYARDIIAQTRTDHPNDAPNLDNRFYGILLLTDGLWTSPQGTTQLGPASADPVPVAGDLYGTDGVPVYVVAIGEAQGQQFADDLAAAGGTTEAIEAGQGQLIPALQSVVEDIQNSVIIPECTSGLPRVMIVLDASSSMLNVNGVAGQMGSTGWDQARAALAGANSIFDVEVQFPNNANIPVEDLIHLGLTTFGSEGEEQVLVNYGPCMKDNFDWALDPNTSCGNGCNDPWGGPPITWTFVGPGDPGYPGFDAPTHSRMPACQPGAIFGGCYGSGTFTHRGLGLASTNAQDYRANPPPLYPIDQNTVFANILITDGAYQGYSTNAQVSSVLTQLYGTHDTTTYVIGLGDGIAVPELQNMACWGSGGTGTPCNGGTFPHYDANNQQDLEQALADIIENLSFDPCCNFNDCSVTPEPTTSEPDPVPPQTSGDDTSSDSSASATDSASDTTDGVTSGPSDTSADDGSGSGSVDDTGGPSTASASASGSDTSDSDPTSPTDPTITTTNATADGGETDGDTDTDGSGQASDDDGCGCSTESSPRGMLGSLMLLGIAGALRRRRRS